MISKSNPISSSEHISNVLESEPPTSGDDDSSVSPSPDNTKSERFHPHEITGKSIAAKLRSMLHIGRHTWAPEKRFVISSMSDRLVRDGGVINARAHNVPKSNRFELEETSHCSEFGEQLRNGSLGRLDRTCRLDLHGHGDMFGFEGDGPFILACKLKRAGLKEVGVIKLQSCRNGKGDFLKEFLEALSQLGIKVGYVSAPVADLLENRSVAKIAGREFTYQALFYMPSKLIRKKYGLFIPETFGLKVVKGNIDVRFPGTRYS